jgi:hypothetical protein
MFQVGRKLAWRLFEHVPFVADPTAGVAKPDSDALMVRGLWKFQELTCDRIGLLCCQDVELATRSILKFASGLPDELLQVDWDSLLAERIAEEEAMLADSPYQFSLLRAAALRQFASEERYEQCFEPRFKAIGRPQESPAAAIGPVDESVIEATVLESESHISEAKLNDGVIPAAMDEHIETVDVSALERDADHAENAVDQNGGEIENPQCMEMNYATEPFNRINDDNSGSESSVAAQHENERDLDDAIEAITIEEPAVVPFVQAEDASQVTREKTLSAEPEALREFTLWGVLWVVGVDAPISDLARAELWEYFGSEAAAAIDELENRDGDERCARRCAAAAPIAAQAPFELRRGALEDVIHLALSAGPIGAVERDRLADLAELLDLSAEDVEQAAAEVIDPEFATYPFTEGQDVEAKFDDEWTAGVVHTVDSSGGVRIYFPSLAQTYWLHPTSDLLRPVEAAANRSR